MKKIKKYVEFFTTKVKVLFEQKYFRHDNTVLKYMLKQNKGSDVLVVVFSACTRVGLRARYNYVRTLKGIPCNQLFILDDFSEDHRGSYYLGADMKFNEEKATKALIESIAAKTGAGKLVFCGSSKGGYAALNFGSQFEGAYVIAGGPQFFLADYLKGSPERLAYIIGEPTDGKKDMLNRYLYNKLINNRFIEGQKYYLHYSDKEHTYEEHIRDMVRVMQEKGYNISFDIAGYENHSDISYYFPEFLCRSIKQIISEK